MKRESLYLLLVALVTAGVSLVVAGIVWAVIVWSMGSPYSMPFFVSLRTAAATRGFGARVLLSAVLVFIILWFVVRAWLSRRPPKAGT